MTEKRKRWGIVIMVAMLTVVFFAGRSCKSNAVKESVASGQATTEVMTRSQGTGKQEEALLPGTPFRDEMTLYRPKLVPARDGRRAVIEIDHGLSPHNAPYTDEMRKGIHDGMQGAITLRVVDSVGIAVPDAAVQGGFWNHGKNGHHFEKMTDAHGMVALQDQCTGDLNFSITKDGYYDSSFRYWFFKNGFDCVKDGRWQPWNPTVEVVLKEKHSPIPMLMKRIDLPMPARDVPVGFDFEAGDWVTPHGKGIMPDMLLTYVWEQRPDDNDWRRHSFTISFTNSLDGAYVAEKDVYSEFKSAYEANNEMGYANTFDYVYERTASKIIRDEKIGEDQWMVFRVRTKTDNAGNMAEAHYGKIYGPFLFAQGPKKRIVFTYYFNPNPDDRNLEAEGMYP